jgi:hypothetical protein
MERSSEFREGLQRELPVWQAEGILTPGAARALTVRYELDEVAAFAAGGPGRAGRLAAAAGIAIAVALAAALHAAGLRDGALLPLVSLAALFTTAPLVARGEALAPAAGGLRGSGRAVFYAAAWLLSFVPAADALRLQTGFASPGLLAALPAFLLAGAAVLAGLRRGGGDPHALGEAMLLVATVLAFAAGLSLDEGTGTALVANLALAFLAVGRIVRGLSWLARAPFLEGLAVAAVLVASRAADVVHSSLARGVAVALVLVGADVAALLFERRRSRAPAPVRLDAV